MKNENKKIIGFFPIHGSYQNLISYQKAEIVQLEVANKNIVEANMTSGTSKEIEIKLTSVARASLEE